MSISLATLAEVQRLCQQVERECGDVAAEIGDNDGYHYGSKRSGALRRHTMDLTRALADLRRP